MGVYIWADNNIVEGYYDMITDSFYSDTNHTTLITPTEGAYYKYIRYETPIFYKYTNGQFIVQKKNATTNTKNTTLSLSRSIRRELCTWNGRGIGIVSGQASNYAQLMKRTDMDIVTVNTEISSVRSDLYAGCGTRQGTIICGVDTATYNLYSLTLDYDNNTISSSYVSSPNSNPSQGNTVDNTGTICYFVDNASSYYIKASISSSGIVSSPTRYSTSSPNNVCGGGRSNGKILVQGHNLSTISLGTLSSDGTSISWSASTSHGLSGANALGTDRKGFIAVGCYNSNTLAYSFNQGANWSTLSTPTNPGGQIYVDEIGDIRYTSESNSASLGWMRFGTFKTEEELD